MYLLYKNALLESQIQPVFQPNFKIQNGISFD